MVRGAGFELRLVAAATARTEVTSDECRVPSDGRRQAVQKLLDKVRGIPARERKVLTRRFPSALTCSQPTMQRGGRALGLPPQPCAGREPRDTKRKKTTS